MQRLISNLIVLLAVGFGPASGLKFLGYNPTFGHSHATFIGKIADVLAEAGHEVVLVTPVLHTGLPNVTSKHARVIHIPAVTDYGSMMKTTMSRQLWDAPTNPFTTIGPWLKLGLYLGKQCDATLQYPDLLEQLRAEKFDAAYTETVDYCGIGLFHLLDIKKFAVTYSMTQLNAHRWHGAPTYTSYIPGWGCTADDRMGLYDRLWNTLGTAFHGFLVSILKTEVGKVFERLHPELPAIDEMVSDASFFFVNTEPLIDFPRPVTRKIVDIGGITVPDQHKPLDEHFSSLLSLRPRTALISFGTITLAHMMPEAYKETIRATARAFPNTTFIWKYEKPEQKEVVAGIPNLVLEPWIPQTDLLHDPRLTAFITHGGAGSTTEATLAGVPLVAVPVMGDQMRNAMMVKRLGNGILVEKSDLAQPEALIAAAREVLDGDRYRARALEVAAMVKEQPQSVRDRLVSHFEFMAKYGPLDQLNHASREMSTITFYNLDVYAIIISVLAAVVFLVVFVSYRVIRGVLGFVRFQKAKAE